MDSLRIDKPGLTHLDLRVHYTEFRRREFEPTLLPIIQCLHNSPSPWSDRLVSLKIDHNIVVEDFLQSASKIIWPNLKAIKLEGAVQIELQDDWSQVDEDDLNPIADEFGSRTTRALITALPSMPKVTDFQIKMFSKTLGIAFKVSMHLGNIARTEKASKTLPCVDSFVSNSNNGLAKGHGIYFHGDTVTRMQDAVRAHRRQELEVFACGDDRFYFRRNPHRPCAKWNRRTESWDIVFKNDMDMFIYDMGQYWEAVDKMERWWRYDDF